MSAAVILDEPELQTQAAGSGSEPPRRPPAPPKVRDPRPPQRAPGGRRGDWRTRRFFGRPWQDLIFAVGEIVFLISLGPLLFKETNVGLFTGLATAFMLYTFMLAHVSYRNWITVCLTGLTATLWVLIGAGVHF